MNGKNVGIHTLYHRDKYGNTLKQTVKLFIPIFGCPITLQEIVSDDWNDAFKNSYNKSIIIIINNHIYNIFSLLSKNYIII